MSKKWTPEKVAKILGEMEITEFLRTIELATGTKHSINLVFRGPEEEES